MHLAGWNFTIYEEGTEGGSMSVIDVMTSDFFQAEASALQQYKPGSTVANFRAISEEESEDSISPGGSRKWISPNKHVETVEESKITNSWPNVYMVNFVSK